MDNMNKTIIPHSLTKTPESNYGSWWVFILFFILLGIYVTWIINKYFISTLPTNKEDIKQPTNTNIPSGTPPEIYKNSSNINENNVILKDDNNLNNVLDNKPQSNTTPIATDSYSNSQFNNSSKTGWCYIGEEGGNRSCIQVGDNDLCMSGNIFPSQEICINPSLRS